MEELEENVFAPQLGKIKGHKIKGSKKYAHQLIAAINRAGGRSPKGKSFKGNCLGRGNVMAAVLASRDKYAAYRQRRVVVKARIVKLDGKGMKQARAHMRYLLRSGVTREGERGEFYNSEHDHVDGREFHERIDGDRHQFRFIVSAEDGLQYDELKSLTRRLMEQMEFDLDTRLEWVAVDHFNTGNPHTHIIVRGKDDLGNDLIISPDYIKSGMRERASELVRLDLGERSDNEIETQLKMEMTKSRFTSLDKHLLKRSIEGGLVTPMDKDNLRQTVLIGRLKHLERLNLAEDLGHGNWRLDPDVESTLRLMGERDDIIKTMQRELKEQNIARSPADYAIHDTVIDDTDLAKVGVPQPIIGKVLARGLSDELNDRHYMIVDGMDGRTHYVEIGAGDRTEPTPPDIIVQITPKSLRPRQVDHTIDEIAAANNGRYNQTIHKEYDPRASKTYIETHVRRLEAIRRLTKGVELDVTGTWTIAPDHLNKVVEYERTAARISPVRVDKLSALTIEEQIGMDGATWLDKQMVSDTPEVLRDSGFGREIKDAMRRRQQWLMEQDLARVENGQILFRSDMLETLEQRELTNASVKVSQSLKLAYAEAFTGEKVEGLLRGSVELASGKFAIVERSRDFTLVPWKSVLEKHIGKEISGVMSRDGISWTIGRQRGLGI